MDSKAIEQQVAEAILQKKIEINIGGNTYEVAPPSVATIILVSEEIGKMPRFEENGANIVSDVFSKAKYYNGIGKLFSTLILGAKGLKTRVRKGWFGSEYLADKIAREILEEYTPLKLNQLLGQLLENLQIGFFFGIISSLNTLNVLKPTKNEMIASGQ